MQGNTCHRMSYHPGRGCPRGRGGHGARPSAPTYRPQNLRLLHPQQPPAQYQYEPPSAPSSSFSNSQAPNFMPPRPDFVPYPPPVAPSAQGPLPPCPVRPPYPNHQMRHPFNSPFLFLGLIFNTAAACELFRQHDVTVFTSSMRAQKLVFLNSKLSSLKNSILSHATLMSTFKDQTHRLDIIFSLSFFLPHVIIHSSLWTQSFIAGQS